MPTARDSSLKFAAWESEDTALAESGDDTYTYRMQVRSMNIDGLQRSLQSRGGVFQYQGFEDPQVVMPYGVGRFSLSFDLAGHGGTAAGALTQTNLHRLLQQIFGSADVTQVGTTSDGGDDADTLSVNAGGTIVDRGMIRVGALGDGAGEGLFYAVQSEATNTVTLRNALAGTASASDVVYAAMLVAPLHTSPNSDYTSSGASFNNTLRWVLASDNLMFVAKGCVCMSATFRIGPQDGNLMLDTEWGCAYWKPVSDTFPSATAHSDYLSVPAVNGGLHIQAKGTTTRNVLNVREFTVDVGLNPIAITGQGGVNAGQNVIGWVRGNHRTTVSFAVEAEATTATPVWHDFHSTDPNSLTAKEAVYTASIVDGSAVGMWFRDMIPTGQVPTQVEIDGLNYVRASFIARKDPDNTSGELEGAPWVLAMA